MMILGLDEGYIMLLVIIEYIVEGDRDVWRLGLIRRYMEY